jgi:pimeloyl-ACP methyl ester carboxylesterase
MCRKRTWLTYSGASPWCAGPPGSLSPIGPRACSWPRSGARLGTVGPLTDPTAHGAAASDAFHLVLPSLPGYGFSGEPTELGWDPGRTARAWAELMGRLGYNRYVAQGGDVGAVVPERRLDAGSDASAGIGPSGGIIPSG